MRFLAIRSVVFFAVVLPMACAQQAQAYFTASGETDPAWHDCGSSDDYNNNDDATGNGPQVGSGYQSGVGNYVTFTYVHNNVTHQFRVTQAACSEPQWTAWQALVGKKIEFVMDNGIITDVHEDV